MTNEPAITPSQMHGVMQSGNSVDSSVSDWREPHSSDPHALKSAQCDAFSLVRHLVPPSAATAGGSMRVDTPLWV